MSRIKKYQEESLNLIDELIRDYPSEIESLIQEVEQMNLAGPTYAQYLESFDSSFNEPSWDVASVLIRSTPKVSFAKQGYVIDEISQSVLGSNGELSEGFHKFIASCYSISESFASISNQSCYLSDDDLFNHKKWALPPKPKPKVLVSSDKKTKRGLAINTQGLLF